MKHFTIHLMVLLILLFTSCKKIDVKNPDNATLTVFNGVVGGLPVLNDRATTPMTTGSAFNNTFLNLALPAGSNDLYFRPFADPLHPYYTQNGFNINAGELYTLFLCGTPTSPEGFMKKESFPSIKDSLVAVRFVNLSPNSTPLNITLSTSTGVYEFSNIAYKQITDFKLYSSLATSGYTWQIRAANNPNVVLASWTVTAATIPRFTYRTYCIVGLVGSSPSINMSQIIHGF